MGVCRISLPLCLRGFVGGAALFLLAGTLVASAGEMREVTLRSGERVVGEVLSGEGADPLIVRSEILGEVRVPRGQVLSMDAPGGSSTGATADTAPEPPAKPASSEEREVAAKPDSLTEAGMASVDGDSVPGTAFRWMERAASWAPPESWKGNLRMGLNLSGGDREWRETSARGRLTINEKETPDIYRFSGSYTYRENERPDGRTFKSSDKYDGTFEYRRELTDRIFLQNSLGGRVDQLKGIDREIQELVGIGYRFEPADTVEFLVGGGGGAEYFEAEFIEEAAAIDPALNLFQEFTWKPFKRTSLVQEFKYFVNPDDTESFNYVLSAAIRIRLTELVGVELSYKQDFDNEVERGRVREDVRWRNSLIVYF